MDDEYYVENATGGGFGNSFTFDDACKTAEQLSIDSSCLMMVRHRFGYIPVVIYHSGTIYKPLDQSGT